MRDNVPRSFIRQALANGCRLTVTLGLGLGMLWAMGAVDPAALTFYLTLLGWRWIASVPALALEMAAIPLLSRGQDSKLTKLAWLSGGIATATLCVLALASGGVSSDLVVATFAWSAAQCHTAPGLARALLAGRVGLHGIVMTSRRCADPLALVMTLLLAGAFDQTIFAVGLIVLAGLHAATAHFMTYRLKSNIDDTGPAPRLVYASSLAVAASQILALRLPVLVLLMFAAEGAAVPAALAFMLAGYVRQAASVGLMGLDAIAARYRRETSQMVGRVSGLAAMCLAVALTTLWLISPDMLHYLLPDSAALPQDMGMILALVLIGIGARILSDLWAKYLTGTGQQSSILPLTLVHGLALAMIYLALPGFVAATAMPLWTSGAFAAGQVLHALLLARRVLFLGSSATAVRPASAM